MEHVYGSSAAVPILTVLALLALWFGISVPLVFFGAYIGFRKAPIQFPNTTSTTPKPVPDQPCYLTPQITVLAGGVLPFGACFVELFFILSSIWMDQYYYVYGFLVLVTIVLVITCAEITIVLLYFQVTSLLQCVFVIVRSRGRDARVTSASRNHTLGTSIDLAYLHHHEY